MEAVLAAGVAAGVVVLAYRVVRAELRRRSERAGRPPVRLVATEAEIETARERGRLAQDQERKRRKH